MLVDFFIVGGVAFWSLTAILALVLISFVSDGKGWASSIALGVYIALITLLGNFNPIAYVTANWQNVLMAIGAYYLGGVVYVYFKWTRFSYATRATYRRSVKEFLTARGINGDVVPDSLEREFKQNYYHILHSAPMVKNYKADIMLWMTFWPFSLVGTFAADLIHNVFVGLYNMIGGSLQRIANKAWEN